MKPSVLVPALALAIIVLTSPAAVATEPVTVRVGALKGGTLSWELDVIAHHKSDSAAGIRIEAVEFPSTEASVAALRDGRIDIILANWLWVSRERTAGKDWTFFPFSTAIGSLLARPDSPVRSVADLKDARVGVAGTPHDEDWLIMRILTTQKYGFDLDRIGQKNFGPPPTISEQLQSGRIDAALTLWQSAARLKADGMRRVMSVTDANHELGITSDVPLLGYVFSEGGRERIRPRLRDSCRPSTTPSRRSQTPILNGNASHPSRGRVAAQKSTRCVMPFGPVWRSPPARMRKYSDRWQPSSLGGSFHRHWGTHFIDHPHVAGVAGSLCPVQAGGSGEW